MNFKSCCMASFMPSFSLTSKCQCFAMFSTVMLLEQQQPPGTWLSRIREQTESGPSARRKGAELPGKRKTQHEAAYQAKQSQKLCESKTNRLSSVLGLNRCGKRDAYRRTETGLSRRPLDHVLFTHLLYLNLSKPFLCRL